MQYCGPILFLLELFCSIHAKYTSFFEVLKVQYFKLLRVCYKCKSRIQKLLKHLRRNFLLSNWYYCEKVTLKFINSWIVNIFQGIFSHLVDKNLLIFQQIHTFHQPVWFQNGFNWRSGPFETMLRQCKNVQLWKKVVLTLYNVDSTLFQRRTTTFYQSCTTLKIQRRILFHFRCWINVISALIQSVETTFSRPWNVFKTVTLPFKSFSLVSLDFSNIVSNKNLAIIWL